MSREALERDTGKLFEKLWGPYDDQLFEQSVELFMQRLNIVGMDEKWFDGKVCLDAGCGGGRNSIAMARLGAAESHGIDLGVKGIEDAKRRAQNLLNTQYSVASIMDIPYEAGKFDLVWCAGVLMIVDDENIALDELTRVLKKDGKLYLLVYATEGMRWPLIEVLRPIATQIGQSEIERAMAEANMPANKRRTFLDDLFCPKLDFYHWDRLRRMLEMRGYKKIDRWGPDVRLDHEHNLYEYRTDLESLLSVFDAGIKDSYNAGDNKALFMQSQKAATSVIDSIKWFESAVKNGKITEKEAMERVIGQGHHRILATKG